MSQTHWLLCWWNHNLYAIQWAVLWEIGTGHQPQAPRLSPIKVIPVELQISCAEAGTSEGIPKTRVKLTIICLQLIKPLSSGLGSGSDTTTLSIIFCFPAGLTTFITPYISRFQPGTISNERGTTEEVTNLSFFLWFWGFFFVRASEKTTKPD